MPRCSAILAAIVCAAAAWADILHLRDGSSYPGVLVSQDAQEVLFRVILQDGRISVLKRFPARDVERVERTGDGRDSPDSREAGGDRDAPDYAQMLREAYELLDDDDPDAAVRALQRVVVGASDRQLAELEPNVVASRGLPLAELLARTRLACAERTDGIKALDLKFVTRYEVDAMSQLLEQRSTELLRRVYQGQSLSQWAASRNEYDALADDARDMVADTRLAAAVLTARLRYDARLKEDRDERRRVALLRDDLARFAAHVAALRGFTAQPDPLRGDPEDPALAELFRLREQQRQRATSQPASQPNDLEQDGNSAGGADGNRGADEPRWKIR